MSQWLRGAVSRGTFLFSDRGGSGMRTVSLLLLLGVLAAGCTPDIPVKPEFGVSALETTGDTPPEFLAFNRYDPRVNPVLTQQMCATPGTIEVVKGQTAVPGNMLAAQSVCATYQPWLVRFVGGQPTQ
jgi:hypothetical protein